MNKILPLWKWSMRYWKWLQDTSQHNIFSHTTSRLLTFLTHLSWRYFIRYRMRSSLRMLGSIWSRHRLTKHGITLHWSWSFSQEYVQVLLPYWQSFHSSHLKVDSIGLFLFVLLSSVFSSEAIMFTSFSMFLVFSCHFM